MVGRWSKRRVQLLQVLVMHLQREGLAAMILTPVPIFSWMTLYCEFYFQVIYWDPVRCLVLYIKDHYSSSADPCLTVLACCMPFFESLFLHFINAGVTKHASHYRGRFPFLHPRLILIGWLLFCDWLFLVYSCIIVLQIPCQMPILCGWYLSFVRFGLLYLGFWISFPNGFLSTVKLILTGWPSGTKLTLYNFVLVMNRMI